MRKPWLWITLAAALATLPLILQGASCGHDFTFHLQNWMEAASQWKQGVLLPRWAFSAAWNAGEPRFLFYPPLSWSLGAVLGLILPWAATTTVFTFVALTLNGLSLYHLAQRWCRPPIATAAACLYLANPYMLFTAYERTAYAELLAAAWMPLLLAALLGNRISIPRLAIPVALLWLTNAPAAVIGCYTILVLGLLRITLATFRSPPTAAGKSINEALRITAATALGIGTAAFYVLPAAYERRYVQIAMAILPGMRPWENYLFAHPADLERGLVLHTASITAVIVIATALVAAAITLLRKPASPRHEPTASLAVLTLAVLVLLTPASTLVWKHAPDLAFLQFPWRFLAVESAAAALLLALALTRLRVKPAVLLTTALVLIATSTLTANHSYRQACDLEDTANARQALFDSHGATEPTDEYTPLEADNDALHQNNPAAWLSRTEDAQPSNTPGVVVVTEGRPDRTHYYIADPHGQFLILNQRAFPGWHIDINHIEAALASHRDDGLISVPLPASGNTVIDLEYHLTPDQWIGWFLTAISLAILIALAAKRRPYQAA